MNAQLLLRCRQLIVRTVTPLLCAASTVALAQPSPLPAPRKPVSSSIFTVLRPSDYHHYVTEFAADELAATKKSPTDEWPWMVANIPFFSSSNKEFEEMYYFRWYAWEKHVVKTPRGYVITEWLPKPADPNGFYGALPDAAPFHLNEARWLRNPEIAADYARMWAEPKAGPRKYSFAWADSVRNVVLATGNRKLGTDLLPALIANFEAWRDHYDPAVGLYWQIDTRDAMEKSIGGDGYRTPLNSYMYADGEAIADFARDAGENKVAHEYATKSATLRNLIETKLWNPKDQFYEDLSPAANSGIRTQKKFKDPGTVLQFSNVRELIGYIPWEFYATTPSHDVAWKQLFNPQGFDGKYGPTTAERRSPRFRFPSSDQCTWNGPSWPYATTQTLLALARLLNGAPQHDMTDQDYYRLFSNYVLSQHIKLADGRTIDWIDEDLDADTDEWIAKDILIRKHKQVGRGNYYNHSGFADPLITGMLGLRPRADNRIILHPLLPQGEWSYFAVDGLPYHGHLLAIVYDQTGKQYHRGRGLMLFVDGKKVAGRPTLGPLDASLPRSSATPSLH